MSALLVITVGQADVQLLVDGERREFDKDRCAALHAGLAQRKDWSLADSTVPKSLTKARDLPAGVFQLCTPKLDAVLDHASMNRLSITAALVLETRRDPEKERGDPGQAGTVLARRLREKLAVAPVVATYLSGVEPLEDRGEPRDAVVRREVVARIDGACREAIEDAKPMSIVIAATGGFPTVGSLVEQIVRLRAGETKVILLDVPDANRTGSDGFDRAVLRTQVPSPHVSFEARRHALELIRGGHLLGAWGAVRHLHSDPVERRWTALIEWFYLWASSLPMPPDCDIELLTHPRRSVRAALRVEFALRAGDTPGAVHGTVAFFEAALWDHLGGHLTPHPDKQRLFSAMPAPCAELVRDGVSSDEEDRKRPFEIDTTASTVGTTYYRVYDDDACAGRLVKRYLKKHELERLARAVSKVRLLRNDVAHNVPTPERMAAAQREMQAAELWSSDDRFMHQDLVTKALAELGVDSPKSLHSTLMREVEKRLLADFCSLPSSRAGDNRAT